MPRGRICETIIRKKGARKCKIAFRILIYVRIIIIVTRYLSDLSIEYLNLLRRVRVYAVSL